MKRILFVCSGNVFRSLTAKVCLKNYLKKKKIKGITVDSAGIFKPTEGVSPITKKEILKKGITFRHKPKKITRELAKRSDLIISMGKNHHKYIKKNFGIDSILFNKLAINKNTGVLDVEEKYPFLYKIPKPERQKKKEYKKHINKTVDYIYKVTPKLAKNILKILKSS